MDLNQIGFIYNYIFGIAWILFRVIIDTDWEHFMRNLVIKCRKCGGLIGRPLTNPGLYGRRAKHQWCATCRKLGARR